MFAKQLNLQLIGAVSRLVHAMALFEQLKKLFHRNARVGGTPQGEDLPHQHPKRPAVVETNDKCIGYTPIDTMFVFSTDTTEGE